MKTDYASISFSDLAKEILKENGCSSEGQDDQVRILRKKYAFLFNHVIMRSKLDFRFKGKDMIPLHDKTIVKGLLTHALYATSKEKEDDLIVKWFNGRIKEDDYITIGQLGYRIQNLIEDELYYDDWDMDEVTRDEWVAAIHSSINPNLALNVIKATKALEDLNKQLSILDHGIPFGDMIKENRYGARVYAWKGLSSPIDPSKPIAENFSKCFSMEKYSEMLQQFIYYMQIDAQKKSIDFIKAYAELKKASGFHSADQFLSKDSLASEYTALFQSIYEYLFDRPELTRSIETEIGTEDLLEFFRMEERNGSAKGKP